MRAFFLYSFFLLEIKIKIKIKIKIEEPIFLTFVYFWGVVFASPIFFVLPFRCNLFF